MKMVPELERCPRDSQISSLRDQCLLLMSWLSGKTGSYQFSSVAQSCPAPCEPMDCSTPGLLVHHPCPNSRSLPKLISIESVMPSNHLILCHALFLPPAIFPRVFSNESALRIRWPKYWSFSFNISPSNEHPGVISFKMDWLDLFAVQGTLKSLQYHSSKASVLRHWEHCSEVPTLSHRDQPMLHLPSSGIQAVDRLSLQAPVSQMQRR